MSKFTYADIETVLKEAPKYGSLKKAFLAHEGFEPRPYGIYDRDNVGKEDLPTLSFDAKSFGEDHLILPKTDPNPAWVDKIWNSINVTPYGRLKARDLIFDDESISPWTIPEEGADPKAEIMGEASGDDRVVAQSFYVRTKLDRDDILDLSNFDVVSHFRSRMAANMKRLFVGAIISNASTESVIGLGYGGTEISGGSTLSDVVSAVADQSGVTSNMSWIVSRKIFLTLRNNANSAISFDTKEEIADLMGIKEIILVDSRTTNFLSDLSRYYVGLPRGLEGDFFTDFDIDYNTNKVMLETKFCGLSAGRKFTISSGSH